MKKALITFTLTIIFICSTICSVYASDYHGNTDEERSVGTSEVVYTVNGSYTIDIPERIVVGEDTSIKAREIDIADDQQIDITIESISDNDLVILENDLNPDYTLGVYFGDDIGNMFTQNDNLVGTFTNNSVGDELYIFTYAEVVDATKPGDYHGSVEFKISCHKN